MSGGKFWIFIHQRLKCGPQTNKCSWSSSSSSQNLRNADYLMFHMFIVYLVAEGCTVNCSKNHVGVKIWSESSQRVQAVSRKSSETDFKWWEVKGYTRNHRWTVNCSAPYWLICLLSHIWLIDCEQANGLKQAGLLHELSQWKKRQSHFKYLDVGTRRLKLSRPLRQQTESSSLKCRCFNSFSILYPSFCRLF